MMHSYKADAGLREFVDALREVLGKPPLYSANDKPTPTTEHEGWRNSDMTSRKRPH